MKLPSAFQKIGLFFFSALEQLRSPLRTYISSLYFCTYTMTSVGYGDIGPKHLGQVCLVQMVIPKNQCPECQTKEKTKTTIGHSAGKFKQVFPPVPCYPSFWNFNKLTTCKICKDLDVLFFILRNILERVACTLIVLTAGLCWAYVLGEVCAIVSDPWTKLVIRHCNNSPVVLMSDCCKSCLTCQDMNAETQYLAQNQPVSW